ncbi:hypothetical protein L198_05674 [Cryptococcus wingfieldii CBS 7118]|uniref:Uncharacterized protein n=1 Tax=Cryptococcus wingfieldii CBS 7118 TaxID=1295528 RepID=A0A1E3ITW1_9TREE|nr:hypothetical protein L198_05674 [Cryptococcus wingfieldii CBS 7118]ODN92002.1 hypothetical protein L198_05674 [Cryptococcus wingfieldii CBS 7118]
MSLPAHHARLKCIHQPPPEHGPIFHPYRFVVDVPRGQSDAGAFGMWKQVQFLHYSSLDHNNIPTRRVGLARRGMLGKDAKLEITVEPLVKQEPQHWPNDLFDSARNEPYPYAEWFTPQGRIADPGCEEWIQEIKFHEEMRDAMGRPTRYVKHKEGKNNVCFRHKVIPTEWLNGPPVSSAAASHPSTLPTSATRPPSLYQVPSPSDTNVRRGPEPHQSSTDSTREAPGLAQNFQLRGPPVPHRLTPTAPRRVLSSNNRSPSSGSQKRDYGRSPTRDPPAPKRLKFNHGDSPQNLREESLRENPIWGRPEARGKQVIQSTRTGPHLSYAVPTPTPPSPPVSTVMAPVTHSAQALVEADAPKPTHPSIHDLFSRSKQSTPVPPTPPLSAALSLPAAPPSRPLTPPLPPALLLPAPTSTASEPDADLDKIVHDPKSVRTGPPKPSAPVQERLAYRQAQLEEWEKMVCQFPDLREIIEWQISKVGKQLEVLRGEMEP